MKSVFTNAKVVADQFDPDAYHHNDAQRGAMDYCMSRGELMSFALCPSRWRNGFESPDSGATKNGSLLDCLVLDCGRFDEKYAIYPDTYLNSKQEEKEWDLKSSSCRQWRDERMAMGITCLYQEDAQEARKAVKALHECATALSLLNCSRKQVLVTADYCDRASGLTIPVKALLDLVPLVTDNTFGRCLGDFKTARSANPSKWAREAFNHNYDAQAALYLDLYVAATKEDRHSFVHLIQENVPPFEVLTPLPILSHEFMEIGRLKYLSALRYYAQCLASNTWPSYATTALVSGPFQIVDPEAWMKGDMPISYVIDEKSPEPELSEMPT